MFNTENVIPYVKDGERNSSTQLLKDMGLKPTSDNYKRLKLIMLKSGCEYAKDRKNHTGYIVDEIEMRKEVAQRSIRLTRH